MNGRKLKSVISFAAVSALLISVFGFFAVAADLPSSAKTVSVAYFESPGFQEGASADAVKSGYSYEFFQKISYYTGWQYNYIYGSREELYDRFLSGEIDLMAGFPASDEYADLMEFPDVGFMTENFYLYKLRSNTNISSRYISTLSGKRVGTLEDAIVPDLEAWAEKNSVKMDLVFFDTVQERNAALLDGTIDCIIASDAHLQPTVELSPVVKVSSVNTYICAAKGNRSLALELSAAIASIDEKDVYFRQDLQRRYFSNSVSSVAMTEEEKEWVLSHESLKAGYLNDFMPYCGTAEDGSVTGIVKDVIPEIFRQLNISGKLNVAYESYNSYEAMLNALAKGEIDVVFPVLGDIWYSEQIGIFQSEPVVHSPINLVYRDEISEKTTATIAVNRNNLMQYRNTLSFYPEATILYCDSIDACFEAVREGQAGSTLLNGLRTNNLGNSEEESLKAVLEPQTCSYSFGIRNGDTALTSLIDRGISHLSEDFAYSVSYAYVDSSSPSGAYVFIRNHFLLFLTGVVVLVLLFVTPLAFYAGKARREKQQETETAMIMKEALEKARSASMAKTAFLANMSHDIRTPMNAIIGYSALASVHIDEKNVVKDYLGKIETSGKHLLSMINDVLDMSRIESGKVQLEESTVNLLFVMDEIKTAAAANVDAHQLTLLTGTEDLTKPDVCVDKLRLKQILTNVVSNAVKFTPAGGTVSFRIRQLSDYDNGAEDYEFRIKDTGIGMSDEFKAHLFESFSRERTSTVSGVQGTGLGLAITKNIVDLMGGRIAVESAQGEGSEFVISLRLKTAVDESAPTGFTPEGEEAAFNFEGKKILLVEDNKLNQEIAQDILEEAGCTVEIADDGSVAVELMQHARPGRYDLILMDVQMPIMNGYEATRAIRALPNKAIASIPIVAMTANAFEEDKKNAMEAGMNGHVSKPVEIPKLMKTLSDILK